MNEGIAKIVCVDDGNLPIDFLVALSNEGYSPIVKGEEYNLMGIMARRDGTLVALLKEYDPTKFVWKCARFTTLDGKDLHSLIKGSVVAEWYSTLNN